MNYPRCWDPARVAEVFTTESRQKARHLFLETHQPFHQIRVDFCKEGPAPGAFITEAQLRTIIEAGRLADDNRLFFIVGEAGSGKSELCQWLEYQSDERLHIPIHIPRRMTNAAHVVALLRQGLGLSASHAGLAQAPLTLRADHLAVSAVVLLYERAKDRLAPIDQWAQLMSGQEFRTILADGLRQVEAGRRTPHTLMGQSQLAALCAEQGLRLPGPDLETCHATVSWLLGLAFEQSLWLGDLKALLTQISEQAIQQGRRPLLLIEDITAFQILGDRLLDYLLDLTSGHYDAVVGVTTGFEKTQIANATLAGDLTHIHHRLRARFVLSDERGRSYGLDEDLIEFARGYLRAVKPDCAACPLQLSCEAVFGQGLYPFTETALVRAFRSLQEEGNPRQTPRLLLEHVLSAVLLAEDIPPMVLDQSHFLQPPPAMFRSEDVDSPALQSLLRWYGTADDTAVRLGADLATHWDVPVHPRLVTDGQVCTPRAYVGLPRSLAQPGQDWQQELREFEAWIMRGGLYPSRETLKRGVERTLLNLGDPRALGNPHCLSLSKAELYYARGDERLPIALAKDSGDQPSTPAYIKVMIAGSSDERGVLEEMVHLGLSNLELSHVSPNLALTLQWAQHHWTGFQDDVRRQVQAQLGGIDLDQVIWTAWQMLWYLYSPEADVAVPAALPGAGARVYAAITPWSERWHPACYSAGEALLAYDEVLRRLFVGTYMLRDTLIDQPRYRNAQQSYKTVELLDKVAAIPLRTIRGLPIRVRPTGHSLAELLSPMQRYAQALLKLDITEHVRRDWNDLRQRRLLLEAQSGLDSDLLRQQLAALRWRCGEVGVAWREGWDQDLEVLRDYRAQVTDELLAAVRRIQAGLRATRRQDVTIWRYQSFRHALHGVLQHPYWLAIAAIAAIQQELVTAARAHYRRDGRQLTNTPVYRGLLRDVRAVLKEVDNGGAQSHPRARRDARPRRAA